MDTVTTVTNADYIEMAFMLKQEEHTTLNTVENAFINECNTIIEANSHMLIQND